jgi:hypothetical protein
MQRLLVLGIAACVLSLMPSVSASAMTILKQNAGITDANGDVIRVHGHRGGRGHHYGWGRGRGHHYGWGRGRGHHYGWSRGRHRGW